MRNPATIQLTDGGPSVAPELAERFTGPRFGEALGSTLPFLYDMRSRSAKALTFSSGKPPDKSIG
jgi:hypothetical protein